MKYLSLLFFSLLFLSGKAQILDDSTKQIYGTHSTLFLYEEDVLNMDTVRRSLDTVYEEFHTLQSPFGARNFSQDLGNFATPTNPVSFDAPSMIGRQFGFTSMDGYVFDPSRVKLFDTRSPYTQLTYLQGTKGQQMLEAQFSRNIKPHWNFGFDLRRMGSKRQIGFPQRNDRQAINTSFQFNTRFHTKDRRYAVVAIYSIFDQSNVETGGVVADSDDNLDSLFSQSTESIVLKNTASSSDRRSYSHIYQQFDFNGDRKLQVYMTADYQSRIMKYKDYYLSQHPGYYPANYYRADTTIERNVFRVVSGVGGLKGVAGKLHWRGYYQFRYMEYSQRFHDTIRAYTEQYIGAAFRYEVKDSMYASVNGQYLLNGGHNFAAKMKTPFFAVSVGTVSYLPAVVQQVYYGNNYQWNNNFKNVTQEYLRAEFSLKTPSFDLTPFGGIDHISRYVYYDSIATPRQDSSSSWVYHAGLTMNLRWKGFGLRETIRWNSVSGNTDVFRLPQFYNHLRLSYSGAIFKRAARVHTGIDVFYKSEYLAYGWSPGMMNYRLSDNQDPFSTLPAALVSNLFVDILLKQFTFFVRFTFVNQGFPSQGYYLTPYYPALPRTMEFGIQWRFYD